jgi:hypothetical protein
MNQIRLVTKGLNYFGFCLVALFIAVAVLKKENIYYRNILNIYYGNFKNIYYRLTKLC